MIVQISGKLVEKKEQSIIINNNGLSYEVMVPLSVLQRIEETADEKGDVRLIVYHYFQLSQSSGLPMLIGFMSEVEKDFFLQFIKVSGIGPRAAVKALNKPISEVCQAIDDGDVKYLKTLSGIGLQRAKEIVAKLQGKVGKFGLIRDKLSQSTTTSPRIDFQEEAMSVLMQLQYTKQEAENMISNAVENADTIKNAEELLNEIYKQKVS